MLLLSSSLHVFLLAWTRGHRIKKPVRGLSRVAFKVNVDHWNHQENNREFQFMHIVLVVLHFICVPVCVCVWMCVCLNKGSTFKMWWKEMEMIKLTRWKWQPNSMTLSPMSVSCHKSFGLSVSWPVTPCFYTLHLLHPSRLTIQWALALPPRILVQLWWHMGSSLRGIVGQNFQC